MPTRSYIPIQPLSAFDARGDRAPDSPMRRNILKLMAASAALAGAGCSGPPQEVIVPYVDMPERMTPGRPLFYASSFTRRGYAQGVLIESNMGRPTKIEGNPAHPASLGATDIYAQASVLQFWDPDRSQTPHLHGQPAGWAQFETALQARTAGWAANGGDGLRILTGSVGSPTLTAQLQDLLQRYPRAQWHRYDPLRDDRAFEASRMAFGRAVDTVYSTDAAATIVTLDADLFGDWPGGIPHARGFVAGRSGRAPAFANRLYAIESVPTLTGAAADNRLALAPHALARFIRQLAAALGMPGVPDVTAQTAVDERASAWLAALAQRLAAQRGTSLIAAGGSVDPASRALVHCLNEYLGNVGKTVQYIDAAPSDACNHTESIAALAADMHAGRVDALIMLGVNPVYQAPADLAFADALARVPFSVHLGLYRDESAQRAAWHLPQAHFLEAWSDARAWDGTQSIVQPAIAPLYEGRCAHRLLALLSADSARSGHALVRRFWQGRRGAADFESFWETALQKGVIADTRQAALDLRAALPPMRDAMETDVLTVVFTSDPSVADGEFANNGWLQELPQPLTKLTWDNAALIGPGTAAALKLKSGDIVRIALPAEAGRSLEAPVLVLAEQAEGAIALPLGYGRWAAGRVGNGVGFNAYRLRTAAASLAALAVSVAPTGRTHPFAITQADQSMEGRDIVPVASVAAFRVQPAFATAAPRQRTPDATLYPKWDYKNYKWGMAIDLNACIGCNVCSIACQAENNIPIVGKE
jgi:anaerobic selenocysteine-containing dehydrogenase